MAITITATAGSASANSFVTEAEVIAYMAQRLNASAWDTVTGSTCTENEKKAMCEATIEVSSLNGWQGTRVTTTQALSWPRQNAVDPDSPSHWLFDSDVVPQRVKNATMELAFQFLNAGTTDIAALDANIGVRVKTVDVISTEWFDPGQRAQGLRRYPRVWRFIAPLMQSSGSQIDLARG